MLFLILSKDELHYTYVFYVPLRQAQCIACVSNRITHYTSPMCSMCLCVSNRITRCTSSMFSMCLCVSNRITHYISPMCSMCLCVSNRITHYTSPMCSMVYVFPIESRATFQLCFLCAYVFKIMSYELRIYQSLLIISNNSFKLGEMIISILLFFALSFGSTG